MIKFFGKIRQKLLSEGKSRKYLKYAIGEIILVVIGILIALQVNNWNINRLERKSETKYLKNIKIDLEKDIINLDYQINQRKKKDSIFSILIRQINGAPINDMDQLASNVFFTLMEDRFTPNNSTYSELASSGNLNIITNDTIKQLLLNLQELYKFNDFGIEHEIYEYREYISKSLFKYIDIGLIRPIYYEKKTAVELNINEASFERLFQSAEYKNGLIIAQGIAKDYVPIFEDIKGKSKRIIELIDISLSTM
ncbi:DUF6090 family protein [Flavobacteriaceae bacterium SZ-1-7]|uniref:DUF6090 family protein n=1 Tax=Tamlana sedimenti TaxID=3134126 RepID=UPI0031211844